MNISITAMTVKMDKDDPKRMLIQLSFDVTSADQLSNIIKSIRKIHMVRDVYRVSA